MTILEALAAFFFALGVMVLLIFLRLRENKYLKKTTQEAISKKLREEIEYETNEVLRKKEKFEQTLKQFSGD